MTEAQTTGDGAGRDGRHFSCSLSAVLLSQVQACAGEPAIGELLRLAGSERSPAYLTDTTNWISYDEAVALWRAGTQVSHHPQFPRIVGEAAARRLNASPVADLLRSLGSPEAVYREIATAATKFSTVAALEAVDVGPGFAEIAAVALDGFPRSPEHCMWTCGLLTGPAVLFGLPPAIVEHEECAAYGAERCLYRVIWDQAPSVHGSDDEEVSGLRRQLEAMHERLRSMFVTASDLIAADDIDDVLARITDRAAVEVRAPRYLLAVRIEDEGPVHCHHKGFEPREAERCARELLGRHPAAHPESWLVVPVRSNRRDYGRLLALSNPGQRFFPQERELFEVYARYAASALDGAAALIEAERRYEQSSALLKLARALATAGTGGEIAQRVADAVPVVVDCDRVGVYVWEPTEGMLTRRAVSRRDGLAGSETERWSRPPERGGLVERLIRQPSSEPIFVDERRGTELARSELSRLGAATTILVPLVAGEVFMGVLSVSVMDRPERLQPSGDLLDRLSGVAAHATTALQNGRLVDQITHQALHDQLTGLANRLQFSEQLREVLECARENGQAAVLFYLDLDDFKSVNDELGHNAGDELLAAVAGRLRRSARAEDLVARLGGDEFAVLLDPDGAIDPDAMAARLADAFTEPFAIAGRELAIAASIGWAAFPESADSAEELLRRADAAMFERKYRRADADAAHTARV